MIKMEEVVKIHQLVEKLSLEVVYGDEGGQ
ncbi:hypothetical protein IGJ02_001079 [Enterococcus sp. DIV0724b]